MFYLCSYTICTSIIYFVCVRSSYYVNQCIWMWLHMHSLVLNGDCLYSGGWYVLVSWWMIIVGYSMRLPEVVGSGCYKARYMFCIPCSVLLVWLCNMHVHFCFCLYLAIWWCQSECLNVIVWYMVCFKMNNVCSGGGRYVLNGCLLIVGGNCRSIL